MDKILKHINSQSNRVGNRKYYAVYCVIIIIVVISVFGYINHRKIVAKEANIQKYFETLKPFADELRSMHNAWEIGINYSDYGKATLRLKNAYDNMGIVPRVSVYSGMTLHQAEWAVKYHVMAHDSWGSAIEFAPSPFFEKSRDENRDKALEKGMEFLKSYESEKQEYDYKGMN